MCRANDTLSNDRVSRLPRLAAVIWLRARVGGGGRKTGHCWRKSDRFCPYSHGIVRYQW